MINDSFNDPWYGYVYIGIIACTSIVLFVYFMIFLFKYCQNDDAIIGREKAWSHPIFLIMSILNGLLFTWTLIFIFAMYHQPYVFIPQDSYWFESASRDRNIPDQDKTTNDGYIT